MVDYNSLRDIKKLSHKEPIGLFTKWFDEAKACKDILAPQAMCVATVAKDEYPSARMIMLTEYSKDGFIFCTDYRSRKAEDIEDNNKVAATFYWEILDRSIRIQGEVEKLSDEENVKYFNCRPIETQLVICSSEQSKVIPSLNVLYQRKKELEEQYVKSGKSIPKPPEWGAYILRPIEIEFYQGQKDGFHDRICFWKPEPAEKHDEVDGEMVYAGEDGWIYERLSP